MLIGCYPSDVFSVVRFKVRETLGLAASFQLPQSATEEMRTELVRATIAELGLNKVRIKMDTDMSSAMPGGL